MMRQLSPVEQVVARARLAWGDSGAIDWLNSPNVRFNGNAKPLDVLRLHGAAAVLDALDGEIWNNYA